MSDLPSRAEALATAVGSHPARLLAVLLVAGALGLLAVVSAWRHARRRADRVWGDRLSAFVYLEIHLGLGFAAVVALSVFIAIAAGVGGDSLATRVDLALAEALHTTSAPVLVTVLRGVTFVGEGWSQAAIGVIVALGLLRAKRRLWALAWSVALAGGGVLNATLKAVYARPRPAFADPILTASGFSFPSGHSMGTFILAGMAAYLGVLASARPGRGLGYVILALAWTVTMGFSRMVLGVHYLTDVLGGFAAGAFWLGVCITGVEIARRRRPSAPTG